MAIIIREYARIAMAEGGQATVLARGVLATDERDLPIKVVTPAVAGVDAPALLPITTIVVMENIGTTAVRYAVRPKARPSPLIASSSHPAIPAGGSVIEAVHGSAIINFAGAP